MEANTAHGTTEWLSARRAGVDHDTHGRLGEQLDEPIDARPWVGTRLAGIDLILAGIESVR